MIFAGDVGVTLTFPINVNLAQSGATCTLLIQPPSPGNVISISATYNSSPPALTPGVLQVGATAFVDPVTGVEYAAGYFVQYMTAGANPGSAYPQADFSLAGTYLLQLQYALSAGVPALSSSQTSITVGSVL